MKTINYFIILSFFILTTNVLAETNVNQKSKSDLDLSIPKSESKQKPDSTTKILNSTKTEKDKQEYCDDLLHQVNNLKGTIKPVSRDVLIKRHEVDCLMQNK